MKIGLIDPGSKRLIFNENFPHPGLAYVAAMMEKHGHQVSILDMGLAGETGAQQFFQEPYDLIGLSATSFSFNQVIECAARIKTNNQDTITVLGGPHAAIGLADCLASSHIDYAIYGEGELTMLALVQVLEKRRRPSVKALAQIPGLIFRQGNSVVQNPARPRISNLDELPFPAYHLFPMADYGLYPLLTSRGCPFGCSFCAIKTIWGTAWRFRSPENIIAEIEYARRRFHWEDKLINILDDSFNVDPRRVHRFCELLLEKDMPIKWFAAGFRADRVSLELAGKMKEAGCQAVSIGIESASNEVLQKSGKRETIEQIAQGIDNLHRAGIPVDGQFMIGNIGDTYETVMESLEFARRQPFKNVSFYLALPYPGTELWEYVKEHGRFFQEDYTQFHHFSSQPVFETPQFPASERARAYAQGRRLAVTARIKGELRSKVDRIKRREFGDLNWRRVAKALERLTQYCLDLALRREQRV